MTNKVFVGNIPWSLKTEDFSNFLTDNGFTFRSVKVILEPSSGRSKGFAFIEFESPEAALNGIAELTGMVCEGRTLFASEANNNNGSKGKGSKGGPPPRERPKKPRRRQRDDSYSW